MRHYTLTYFIGSTILESYSYNSLGLCNWKKKQLKETGYYNVGKFKILIL